MKRPIGLICLLLSLALWLATLSFGAAADSPALGWEQTDAVTPGEAVTLDLTLPKTELAGGFLQLSFDSTLLSLETVTLSPAAQALTLTRAEVDGHVNLLLDGLQNVTVDGTLLSLTFRTSEEIQPGAYEITCTVPDPASFYALDGEGNAHALQLASCTALLTVTDPPVAPSPVRYLACQETDVRNDTFSVRLCAAAERDLSGRYGFSVLITDPTGSRELTLGGSALCEAIEGGGQEYTASQMQTFALYTSALTLDARGEVTLKVTPFLTDGETTLYGGTYTIVYLDGVYQTSFG